MTNDFDQELEEFSKYGRTYFHTNFWEISKQHQKLHIEFLARSKQLFTPDIEFQEDEFYDLRTKANRSGVIAIVFAVMYIEGAIYNCGAVYLGDSFIRKNLDKLSLQAKISTIMKVVTGKDMNTDGQAFEYLNKLVKFRNFLIHPKSQPLGSAEEILVFQKKYSSLYKEAIRSAELAIKYLDQETGL